LGLLYGSLSSLGVEPYPDYIFTVKGIIRSRGKVDIIHFHWLIGMKFNMLESFKFLTKLILARILGYKIVWTAHNIRPHENINCFGFMDHFFLMNMADAIITHGQYAKDAIIKRCRPGKKFFVIRHPGYIGYYPNTKNRSESRRYLGINEGAFVYLFFGLVRKYKGLDYLIESFEKLNGDAVLLIAGEIMDKETGEYLDRKAVCNNKMRLFKKFVPDDDVQIFFNSADVVVLPFTEVTTSGSLMLAFSFAKPVISVRKGNIPEIVTAKTGLLVNEPKEIADALEAVRRMDLTRMGEDAFRAAGSFSWKDAAEKHKEAYMEILK
jgi:glycosyltransferase involved in cell wall biosynthesis